MSNSITGTFDDGKNARILHKGTLLPVKSVISSSELVDYPGEAANAGDTVDRWRPFQNEILDPSDLGTSNWTATRILVESDGQTLDEGTETGFHTIAQAITLQNTETVVSVEIERKEIDAVAIQITGSGNSFSATVDLRTGQVVQSLLSADTIAKIVRKDTNIFLVTVVFTPIAGSGTLTFLARKAEDNYAASYTGENRKIKIVRFTAHESSASLRYDLFTARGGDCIGISAHNLWSSGSRIQIEHDSDIDDVWTTIDTLTPENNSPIMFFFNSVTSSRWRIVVDRGSLPEIGVFRVGSALKMERTFYGGFSVPKMSRSTQITGNISGSGELLGRSKKRTVLQATYQWQNLTYPWVRANLDGTSGLIQSAEAEPLFISWRPSETDDVDYVMRSAVNAPVAQGVKNLWSFDLSGEVYSYE